MKIAFQLFVFLLLVPVISLAQQVPPAADTTKKPVITGTDSTMVAKDTTAALVTTPPPVSVVKKDCYAEWLDAFRTRGAKPVPDGMQQVIIALKDSTTCHCFMGQVEVIGGKIKPPLFFQQENGEYRPVAIVGKKLEPAFAGSLTTEELYAVKDGMSIVFRTTDQEYGRLFFYKYANKSAQSNKEAPSPSSLIKD